MRVENWIPVWVWVCCCCRFWTGQPLGCSGGHSHHWHWEKRELTMSLRIFDSLQFSPLILFPEYSIEHWKKAIFFWSVVLNQSINQSFTSFHAYQLVQLHHIDGLTNLEVRHVVSESNLPAGEGMPLVGSTGQVWGMVRASSHTE